MTGHGEACFVCMTWILISLLKVVNDAKITKVT